jgi:hypothetical protein
VAAFGANDMRLVDVLGHNTLVLTFHFNGLTVHPRSTAAGENPQRLSEVAGENVRTDKVSNKSLSVANSIRLSRINDASFNIDILNASWAMIDAAF